MLFPGRIYAYIANLRRNARIESENLEPGLRGHVMFMHSRNVNIQYAGFYGLGRSNKSLPVDDPLVDEFGNLIAGTGSNPRGRYSAHFHRNGINNDDNPAVVHGSVVVDSMGWGFVNHSSFVDFTSNVAYDVDGAAFVTEAGDEIGVFDGNLAIHSIGGGPRKLENGIDREDLQDFGHGGDGYWFQGAGFSVTNNIASGQVGNGFVFFTRGLQQPGLGTTQFLSENLSNGMVRPTS